MERLVAVLAMVLVGTACVPNLTSPDAGGDDTGAPWSWDAPENTWHTGAPVEGLVGEGLGLGQVAPDFRMGDQHGDTVSLWQFYGRVTVLDIGAIWCAPCQDLARGTQETVEHFEGENFTYVTVLAEDLEGGRPDPEDIELWVNNFTIETAPVLGDDEAKSYTGPFIDEANGQLPIVRVLDEQMVVRKIVSPPTDANLRTAVEEVLWGSE